MANIRNSPIAVALSRLAFALAFLQRYPHEASQDKGRSTLN